MSRYPRYLLQIPLLTSQSLPQLRKSVQSFINDPLVPEFPSGAFVHLRNFNINVAFLNLETPDRIVAARKFLGGLNFNKILDDVTVSSVQTAAHTAKPFDSNASTSDNDSCEIDPAPESPSPSLTVHIKTLYAGYRESFVAPEAKRNFSKCQRLFVNVVDPTSRLETFRGAIRRLLKEAGFLEKFQPDTEKPFYKSHKIVDLNSVTRRNANGLVFEKGEKAKEANQSLMTFDATEILKKYRKFTWAEEFELEKLTITVREWSGRDLKGPGRAKTRHIISFPLRQAIPISGPTGESAEIDRLRRMLSFADLGADELPLGSMSDRVRRRDIRYS